MAINWFPGHMHKTRKALKKLLQETDVVVEVLDARLPHSSQNPIFAELCQSIPVIKLLNKQDMADSQATAAWLAWFQQSGVAAMPLSAHMLKQPEPLIQAIRDAAPEHRGTVAKPIRVLVVGIPNVGKSTLLNHLLQRRIAKVGNIPAVTKDIQRVKLVQGVVIYDSPGVMWTKPETEASGYMLALSGAIADTAFEYPDVGMFAAEYLMQTHAGSLQACYQLSEMPDSPLAVLEAIARKRQCITRGEVDWDRASRQLIQDFRQGKLGAITLEQPN